MSPHKSSSPTPGERITELEHANIEQRGIELEAMNVLGAVEGETLLQVAHRAAEQLAMMNDQESEMTIALKITLLEDWKNNAPEVLVKQRTLRGDHIVASLTPAHPEAHVTITALNDLVLEPSPGYTVGELKP